MVWIFDYSYLQCLVANLVTDCFSTIIIHKMKNRKCHTIRTVLKYYRNLVEPEAKLIPLTDIYITANLSGLIQALQLKVAKLN